MFYKVDIPEREYPLVLRLVIIEIFPNGNVMMRGLFVKPPLVGMELVDFTMHLLLLLKF